MAAINLSDVLTDVAKALPLFIYVMAIVTIVTRKLYSYMLRRGFPKNVAVYYNRKVIHMSAGGLVALLVPIVFKEPLTPFIFSLVLAILTLYPHIKRREFEWFQTKDNVYEVNFCVAWGTSIIILWLLLNNPWVSIVPALMISFGDAVTGIVRNAVFGRRTKHWVGNIAMAFVSIPLGYAFAGVPGAVAGAVSSAVERFEFGLVDDNILIAFTSTATLLIFKYLGF